MPVRLAQPEDARSIAQVHVLSWKQGYAGMIDASYLDAMKPEDRYVEWEHRLADDHPDAIFLVAERDGEIVGFGSSGLDKNDNEWKLMSIYFVEKAWGAGLGHALMTQLEAFLATRPTDRATLEVHADNVRAQRFYERRGWTRVGEPFVMSLRSLQLPSLRYELDLRPIRSVDLQRQAGHPESLA